MRLNNNLISTNSYFNFAYFSQGESFQCGIAQNPLLLTYSSYYISDGTEINNIMQIGITCEWIINVPNNITIIFEILSINLRGGGKLFVYDGFNDNSTLLWSCMDCFV